MVDEEFILAQMGRQEIELVARGWPAALIKATVDPFRYALGLANGPVIVFESAEPSRDRAWVHLTDVSVFPDAAAVRDDHRPAAYPQMTFDRGIDVRVSEIVWVCDAPWGS